MKVQLLLNYNNITKITQLTELKLRVLPEYKF